MLSDVSSEKIELDLISLMFDRNIFDILPLTDINSITWPQIQPLLRPFHGLCVACRTLASKTEI